MGDEGVRALSAILPGLIAKLQYIARPLDYSKQSKLDSTEAVGL